jgi:hypothetical protein
LPILTGKSIVCFGGEDWWYHHPHSKNHLMRRFARAGNHVVTTSIMGALFKNGRALFGRCYPDFLLSSGSASRLLLYKPAPMLTPDART